MCSESELEEVLTVFTKLNQSASVFLRCNSRPVSAAVPASSSSSSPMKGRDTSPGKPRVKDQTMESGVRHSSVDKHEGAKCVL